ncbi:hypothetical protein ACKRLN_05965 [Anaerococcus sp. DFU013_CI05]|uniref:hypothetical protein n=1 Tax=unclassified Anaerococcus TaxID=2614126 RepID=UPI001934479A|nr:hypothetical protein [Anaerococcus sp. mt242]MBM0045656.1 hypothetical protein [Anaerococcus sp. mt242]
MNRDYKIGPIIGVVMLSLIIQIVLLLIYESVLDSSVVDLGYIFLSTIIIIVTRYIISYGLIHNRMGNFKDYLHNIKHLTFNSIGVLFFLELIKAIFELINDSDNAIEFIYLLFSDSLFLTGMGLIIHIVLLIVYLIFLIYINYRYFVVADRDDLPFTFLIRHIFKVGKDLTGHTIKIFLKYVLLPGFVLVLIILSGYQGFIDIGGIPFLALIIVILGEIWDIFITIKYSNVYLDYIGNESMDVKKEVFPKKEETEKE